MQSLNPSNVRECHDPYGEARFLFVDTMWENTMRGETLAEKVQTLMLTQYMISGEWIVVTFHIAYICWHCGVAYLMV